MSPLGDVWNPGLGGREVSAVALLNPGLLAPLGDVWNPGFGGWGVNRTTTQLSCNRLQRGAE